MFREQYIEPRNITNTQNFNKLDLDNANTPRIPKTTRTLRNMFSQIFTGALVALGLFAAPAAAHSWPEYINTVDGTGALTQNSGYPRHWMKRTDPGWSDEKFTHRIIDISADPPACSDGQTARTQTPGLDRLQASAGDMVAIRYLENGHVTQPNIPPGHAAHSGTVYVYGSQDVVSPKLSEMLQWTTDGTGGDGKGKLLVSQPFDDGRCYQVNPASPIYQARSKQYPNNNMEMPCQNDFVVPAEAQAGQPYSIFWLWNWTMVADNANPKHQELYTSCADLDIKAAANAKPQAQKAAFNAQLPLASAAVPAYFSSLAGNPTPAANASAAPVASGSSTSVAVASPTGAPMQIGASGGAVQVPVTAISPPAVASSQPTGKFNGSVPVPAAVSLGFAANKKLANKDVVPQMQSGRPSVVAFTAPLPSSAAAAFSSAAPLATPLTMTTIKVPISTTRTAPSPNTALPIEVMGLPDGAGIAVVEVITMVMPGGSVTMLTTQLPRATDKPASFTMTVAGLAQAAAPSPTSSSPSGLTSSSLPGFSTVNQSISSATFPVSRSVSVSQSSVSVTVTSAAKSTVPSVGSASSSAKSFSSAALFSQSSSEPPSASTRPASTVTSAAAASSSSSSLSVIANGIRETTSSVSQPASVPTSAASLVASSSKPQMLSTGSATTQSSVNGAAATPITVSTSAVTSAVAISAQTSTSIGSFTSTIVGSSTSTRSAQSSLTASSSTSQLSVVSSSTSLSLTEGASAHTSASPAITTTSVTSAVSAASTSDLSALKASLIAAGRAQFTGSHPAVSSPTQVVAPSSSAPSISTVQSSTTSASPSPVTSSTIVTSSTTESRPMSEPMTLPHSIIAAGRAQFTGSKPASAAPSAG